MRPKKIDVLKDKVDGNDMIVYSEQLRLHIRNTLGELSALGANGDDAPPDLSLNDPVLTMKALDQRADHLDAKLALLKATPRNDAAARAKAEGVLTGMKAGAATDVAELLGEMAAGIVQRAGFKSAKAFELKARRDRVAARLAAGLTGHSKAAAEKRLVALDAELAALESGKG